MKANFTMKTVGAFFGKKARYTGLVLVATGLVTAGSSIVHAGDNGVIDTVYHVYQGDQKIATVSDKQIIDDVIDEKIDAAEQQHSELTYKLGQSFSILPERTFSASYQNERGRTALEKSLEVDAKAVGILVEGEEEPVVYVQDKATAKSILKDMKTNFVDEKDLDLLEKKQEASSEKNQANENGTQKKKGSTLLDVRFSKKVSFKTKFVDEKDILSEDDARKLLKKGSLEDETHVVEQGEVFSEVATTYDLDTDKLMALNPGIQNQNQLRIGQSLNVTARHPYLSVVVSTAETKEETIPFKTVVKEDDTMYKGEDKVTQQGKDGSQTVTYQKTKVNGVLSETTVIARDVTGKAQDKVVVKGTKVVPSRGTGELAWPTNGGSITSRMGQRWGKQHKGIDIAGASNLTIKAADNGVVEFAGVQSGYGNKIVIDHNNGTKTIYAHMSSLSVSAGETVPKGTKIGVMGSTGQSTGTHLHFEVYVNGTLTNPLTKLPSR
ncbi:LysM peptidoglycan-binding domain-containing M23 family metallopeptidase [Aureibacillus halotolerans]|uniref:Murein DD-endopeptidase MepM/ murein hydrolase activator NlpD n=1 Tax=Aureibacillus halotolerans TaxID=1508390 RepID=A0A4R6TWW8_9BACI|nr:M23 family metallopeptidase [Aureibacillus halotolerans]TDQ38368.1 murein DD-endopeptidase MepM/ murein hydrolase activator NlpD [Aureibacillus halotolerans]